MTGAGWSTHEATQKMDPMFGKRFSQDSFPPFLVKARNDGNAFWTISKILQHERDFQLEQTEIAKEISLKFLKRVNDGQLQQASEYLSPHLKSNFDVSTLTFWKNTFDFFNLKFKFELNLPYVLVGIESSGKKTVYWEILVFQGTSIHGMNYATKSGIQLEFKMKMSKFDHKLVASQYKMGAGTVSGNSGNFQQVEVEYHKWDGHGLQLDNFQLESLQLEKSQKPIQLESPAQLQPVIQVESSKKNYARAKFQFLAGNESELSFNLNDILEILTPLPSTLNWWQAKLNGRIGEVPSNYLQVEDGIQLENVQLEKVQVEKVESPNTRTNNDAGRKSLQLENSVQLENQQQTFNSKPAVQNEENSYRKNLPVPPTKRPTSVILPAKISQVEKPAVQVENSQPSPLPRPTPIPRNLAPVPKIATTPQPAANSAVFAVPAVSPEIQKNSDLAFQDPFSNAPSNPPSRLRSPSNASTLASQQLNSSQLKSSSMAPHGPVTSQRVLPSRPPSMHVPPSTSSNSPSTSSNSTSHRSLPLPPSNPEAIALFDFEARDASELSFKKAS